MGKSALRKFREKSGKKVILVVEDEPALIQFYQYALEDDYDIFIASSGEEAFNALNTLDDIDLMLLDFKLPGISGMDVLNEMKRSFPSIPVMMVSASKRSKTVAESTALETCEYLEKPFKVSALLDKIKSLVEKNR
jgi:DNA-binding response OmpR family regulator